MDRAQVAEKITFAGLKRIRVRSRGQVQEWAESYCAEKVIPQEYMEDVLHVAVATLWRADALVSYNFTHLVRLDTMAGVNAINRRAKLAEIFLCQPSEVIRR